MSTEEIVEVGHQEGPAWSIVEKCATYDEADQKRLQLELEEGLQVKVHWQGKVDNRYYAVKSRPDPALAEAEELDIKREEKRRRKAKLNKKRRKK